MKLLLLGATGGIGKCVLSRVQQDLPTAEVTIFVRSRSKLEQLLDETWRRKITILEGDIRDTSALEEAFAGQEACICTAGNASTDPQDFRQIFAGVLQTASNMVGPKRLWMMAGVTIMALPGTHSQETLNDLPIFRWLPFSVHSRNYEALISDESGLDWSLMCPGQLFHAPQSQHTSVLVEEAAIWLPPFLHTVTPLRLLAAIVCIMQLRKFSVSYDDVASAMVHDLIAERSSLSKKRVSMMKG